MSKKKQPRQPTTSKTFNLDHILAWVLLTAMLVINLIVRIKAVEHIYPTLAAGVSSGVKFDIFAAYKFSFLLAFTIIALTLLLGKIIFQGYHLKPGRHNPLLMVLLALILLSLAVAEYKSAALFGYIERREGALTFLCCLGLFIAALNAKLPAGFTHKIGLGLAVIVMINLGLGAATVLGINPAANPTISSLITPASLNEYNLAGALTTTLANVNFASGLAAALTAGFFVLALQQKKGLRVALTLIVMAASFLWLLASRSSSGFVALFIALPLIIALSFPREYRRRNAVLLTGAALLILVSFMIVKESYPQLYHEAIEEPRSYLQQIPAIKKTAPAPAAENSLNLPPPGQSPGSGRLYIWEKTAQLVLDQPLLGYGKDTLFYYFPQNDPEKRANLYSYRVAVDKPHNFYLEIAFGFGLPALLCLLAFFLYSLYTLGRYTFKMAPPGEQRAFSAAVLAFAAVYLLQWLFNDAVIGSTVIFWVLLGLALSIALPAPQIVTPEQKLRIQKQGNRPPRKN